jgi:MFS family permease
MFISVVVIFIGTIVQATATNLAAFMIGRFLLGVGAALGPSSGLPCVSEMAHPTWRGNLTGFYNTYYFVGSIPGTFIPYGTSTINGTNSWRIPIWIQMVLPGIVGASILFSPRYASCIYHNIRN